MSTLGDALNGSARTENGALQNVTSGSRCLDFFTMAGSARKSKQPADNIRKAYELAYGEDPILANMTLLWAYDCRGGAGSRDVMTATLPVFLLKHPQADALKLLNAIPVLGRYDMLSNLLEDTNLPEVYAKHVMHLLSDALENPDTAALCAKWLPRKGIAANRMKGWLKCENPKAYRKLLSQYKTTETLMSAGKWGDIEYEHVPSVCFARSKNAFRKHDEARFDKFTAKVVSGEAKVNAGVVFPHDVVRSLLKHSGWSISVDNKPEVIRAAEAQWKSLPDLFEGTNRSIFPIVDVSGSMYDEKSSGSLMAVDIALSLGLYCAERQRSAFKDELLCFSGRPTICQLKGDLAHKLDIMLHTPDNCNTDLGLAIRVIVEAAKRHRMKQEDLPDALLVLSDMQFDEMRRYGTKTSSVQYIQSMFRDAGYKAPVIVYWNLEARKGTGTPVLAKDKGIIMVSGFSTSVLKGIMKGVELESRVDPMQVMLSTVVQDRYDLNKY